MKGAHTTNSLLLATLPTHKKVLVCPLDWGLGHATRCIPLIKGLVEKENEVVLAADGAAYLLLEKEFPHLPIIRLKGYRIQYAKTAWGLVFKMASIVPRLFYSIYKEHKELDALLKNNAFDWVISDNRYGLWNKKVTSVFITHQLQLKFPFFLIGFQTISRLLFTWFISKYNACWVPDYSGATNLSGALSHFKNQSSKVVFIGPLSRMKLIEQSLLTKTIDLLFVLSGPEPQRSIFERIILEQLEKIDLSTKRVVLIRGLMESKALETEVNTTVEVKDYALTKELTDLLLQSKTIVCRSGYSTIMDLEALGLVGVYVPTPGQTEQVYLAAHLSKTQHTQWMSQSKFDLTKVI